MMETLRILFSAVFLSAVFLGAYYYVNTPATDRQTSLSSFFGDENSEDDSSAPADNSFGFDNSNDSDAEQINILPAPGSDPFNPPAPIMPPMPNQSGQQAIPSGPYASSANAVAESVIQNPAQGSPNPEPFLPPDPSVDVIAPVAPIDPVATQTDPVAPIDPIPIPVMPDSNANPAPSAPPVQESEDRAIVAKFIEEAKQRIDRGEILTTLITLSKYYNAPQFTPQEASQIHSMLMRLAGEVIYIHPEKYFNLYTVQPGDTISSIANQHQIPWQFIAKINGLSAPYHVQPGEQIKVVRGPFNAEVHLDKFELTLWLPIGNNTDSSIYAGTFLIGLGSDCPKLQGDYIVDEKFINPEYPKFSNNTTTFGPGDSNNPYGARLLALSCVSDPNHVKIGIHGTTENTQYIRKSVPYGYICLGARDINDLYDILSVGSRIKVER